MGGGRFEPSARGAYHEVLLRVVTGQVPETAAAVLALSKLTPLQKPGGGVRPIASPAILRRLAGKALVGPRRKELAEALGGGAPVRHRHFCRH